MLTGRQSEVLSAVAEHGSFAAAARVLGCSRQSVRDVYLRAQAREADEGPHRVQRLSDRDVHQIRTEAFNGKPGWKIAEERGYSRQHINRVLRGRHHQSNKMPALRDRDMSLDRPPAPNRKLPVSTVRKYRALYAEGKLSMREAARRLGISYPAARLMLRGETYKEIGYRRRMDEVAGRHGTEAQG